MAEQEAKSSARGEQMLGTLRLASESAMAMAADGEEEGGRESSIHLTESLPAIGTSTPAKVHLLPIFFFFGQSESIESQGE